MQPAPRLWLGRVQASTSMHADGIHARNIGLPRLRFAIVSQFENQQKSLWHCVLPKEGRPTYCW
jgi:hypothetical protein